MFLKTEERPQGGYTLVELVTVLFAVAGLCVAGFIIYAIVHFALKFW